MSVKSKQSSTKDKNRKRDKIKKVEESDEDIESSEEELDLTKECHPIGYYINDRAEMINQMFSVIKGNKLKAMLPPILKDTDIEQLKLQCLDQLLGMSDKRITCILEGETLETSSESEVLESDECDSDEKNASSSNSSSQRSYDSNEDNCVSNMNIRPKKRKSGSVSDVKSGKEPDGNPPEQGKTLLEILELEMRARAIRALLKQSGNEKGGEPSADETKTDDGSKAQEISDEVVDLTECDDEEFPVHVKKENCNEIVDRKELTFENKIEKLKTEKSNSKQEGEKNKKLQAELELRNKLFKKKVYRTRQQRMENEEDDRSLEKTDLQSDQCKSSEISANEVVVKQEPVELMEVVVEDPEEGEVSTSEDEYPVEIKQEVIEPENSEEHIKVDESFTKKMDEDAERITAIDNGNFVSNSNLENVQETQESHDLSNGNIDIAPEKTVDKMEEIVTEGSLTEVEENKEAKKLEGNVEETSWRDRWLQKDGVQKLVKSSKIYAKVKKRIAEKSLKAKEDGPLLSEINSDSNSNSKMEIVEGSIEEYERLFPKNSKENESVQTSLTNKTDNSS